LLTSHCERPQEARQSMPFLTPLQKVVIPLKKGLHAFLTT